MIEIRRFHPSDAPTLWTLNSLPNVGATADAAVPLPLPESKSPPPEFPDLENIEETFIRAGGDFYVARLHGHIVGMGGIRANARGQAEVLRVRVHPAARKRGIGRALMDALEQRARSLGFDEMFLDTATNQHEAVNFYRALGYTEVGTETHPEWSWTLIYFTKELVNSYHPP